MNWVRVSTGAAGSRVAGSLASSYEGEGFLILRHPETEKVEEGLRRAVARIRVELGS